MCFWPIAGVMACVLYTVLELPIFGTTSKWPGIPVFGKNPIIFDKQLLYTNIIRVYRDRYFTLKKSSMVAALGGWFWASQWKKRCQSNCADLKYTSESSWACQTFSQRNTKLRVAWSWLSQLFYGIKIIYEPHFTPRRNKIKIVKNFCTFQYK